MPLFVTVTPGTTISNTTTLDPTTLNLLGTPSVDVTGTVDGGSLSLSDGSVGNAQLAAHAVTFDKMQQIGTDKLIGRDTAGTGDATEIGVGGGLEFSGSNSIQIQSGTSTSTGVTYSKIQHVSATNKLLGRKSSGAGTVEEIGLGSGLTISGGNLNIISSFFKFSNNSSLVVPKASSSPVPWQSKIEHHLSGMPSLFRIYALWNGASASVGGFTLGQQVTIESLFGFAFRPAFTCWADSTYIYISRAYINSAPILCTPTTGADYVNLASEFDSGSSNWTFAVEAVRFT